MSDRAGTSDGPARPLELDPERATRPERAHYAVVDIGSNSVRLVVYDQLGRAPLPRFNEKSLCRLGEGLAQTGRASRRKASAARSRRRAASAPSPTRWASAGLDATATEAIRRATQRRSELVAAIGARVRRSRCGSSAAPRRRATRRSASSPASSGPVGLVGDMGGGSLEVAEALDDRVGERWVSLPLGALPVRSRCWRTGRARRSGGSTQLLKDGLPPALTEPVFYAVGGGWRALRQGAHGGDRGAGAGGRTATRSSAADAREFAKKLWRLPEAKVAALPGVPDPPRRDPAGGGAGARPRAEAPRARAGGLLRASACARAGSTAQLADRGALSRPAGRGRAAGRPAARACPSSRRPWRAGPPTCFPARRRPRRACGSRSARSPTSPGATTPEVRRRGELPPPAAVPVHRPRPCRARVPRRRDPRPLRRQARRPVAGAGHRRCSRRAAAAAGADPRPASCCSAIASPAACRRSSTARGLRIASRRGAARGRPQPPACPTARSCRPAEARRRRARGEAHRGRRGA